MKPETYYINVGNAAHAAHTTRRKMLECLDAIGCPVDETGAFRLDTLLRAVRVNVDPAADRRAAQQSVSRSIRKTFPRAAARK